MNDQEAIVLLKSDSHEAFEYLYKVMADKYIILVNYISIHLKILKK